MAGRGLKALTWEVRSGSGVNASTSALSDIRGFHLLSAGVGWLWTGPRLYWTRDAGMHWSEITPPNFAANPLDVLALKPQEAAEEAHAQFLERGVLAGIGLRRLAEEQSADGNGSSIWLTLRRGDHGRAQRDCLLKKFIIHRNSASHVTSSRRSLSFARRSHIEPTLQCPQAP